MRIPLHPDAPKMINCKVYPLTREEEDYVCQFLKEEQEKEYIYPGASPIVSPTFVREKKEAGEKQIIMDYRQVNKYTIRDNDVMVNIHTILESLTGKELFSKFNIRWGYKNIRIAEEDQHKAAFKTTFGTYIPRVMYFGLTNTPPHFQRVLRHNFADVLQKYPTEVFNYMDDFAVATKKSPEGLERHRKICHELLDIMEKQSYFLKLSKCQFEQPKMDVLGWLVEDGNVKIDPAKVAGIAEWPRELKSVKEVRSTLGVLGYQRPFI
jgi:Reverse transcriptase (RNA-dependent DNA polymerase)